MLLEVDRLGRDEWRAALRSFSDANLNQAWEFGEHGFGGSPPSRAAFRDTAGRVVALAQLRLRRVPLLGGGIATLYGGPVWRPKGGCPDPARLAEILAALRSAYVLRRRFFLRVTPLVEHDGFDPGPSFAAAGFERRPNLFGTTGREYRTIVLDLSPSLDVVRARLRSSWRRHLARAERQPLEARFVEGAEGWGQFMALYARLLERKGFAPTVDPEELAGVFSALEPEDRPRILVVFLGDRAVAGGVFAAFGDRGVYLYGATVDEGLRTDASYLLHWRFVTWLRENGFRAYDLGGTDPEGNPGVHHFKAGFGGREAVAPGIFEPRSSRVARRVVPLVESVLKQARRRRG